MKKAILVSLMVLLVASLANATMVHYQVTKGDGSPLDPGNQVMVTVGTPVTLAVWGSSDTLLSGITSMFVWDTTAGSAGSAAVAAGTSKLVGSLATAYDPSSVWGGPRTGALGGAQGTVLPRQYGTYLSLSQGSGLLGQVGPSNEMVKLYSITITPQAGFTGYTGGLWYDGGTSGIGYRSYGINFNGGAKIYPDISQGSIFAPVNFMIPEPITLVLLSLGGLFLRRRMA